MFRITRSAGEDSVEILKLKGTLRGPWVQEAHDARALCAADTSCISLDLSGLTFADDDGVALLAKLIRSGARVAGCSSYIAELLRPGSGS